MTTQAPRSCLVHGPSGCGKTTNAQAIWIALTAQDQRIEQRSGLHFKARAMTFDQAMQITRQQGTVV